MRKKGIWDPGSSRGIRSGVVKTVVVVLVVYVCFASVKSLKDSIIFLKKDRLNVVFYEEAGTFISFGEDNVHYRVSFRNDLKIQVPGGYGLYKIGSLGKLARIEKRTDLIQKAFSSAVSATVDFYFYPKDADIHLNTTPTDKSILSLIKMVFSPKYISNASFLERLVILAKLTNKRKTDFLDLDGDRFAESDVFAEKLFSHAYKGYFYQRSLRDEEKNIRLIYNRLSPAHTLSRILEGDGVRIVDLSYGQKTDPSGRKKCIIQDTGSHKNKLSLTSQYLAKMLDCKIEAKRETGDIVMILGRSVEKEWE